MFGLNTWAEVVIVLLVLAASLIAGVRAYLIKHSPYAIAALVLGLVELGCGIYLYLHPTITGKTATAVIPDSVSIILIVIGIVVAGLGIYALLAKKHA